MNNYKSDNNYIKHKFVYCFIKAPSGDEILTSFCSSQNFPCMCFDSCANHQPLPNYQPISVCLSGFSINCVDLLSACFSESLDQHQIGLSGLFCLILSNWLTFLYLSSKIEPKEIWNIQFLCWKRLLPNLLSRPLFCLLRFNLSCFHLACFHLVLNYS